MSPKQGLGSCQILNKLKANDKATFLSLTEKGALPSASAREPEREREREFVVDSGRVCIWSDDWTNSSTEV